MTPTLEMVCVRIDVPGRTLFDRVDLSVSPGESVAIVGASGAGKTTLLNCAAGIRSPNAGTVRVGGRDLAALGSVGRSELRLRSIGMIFQFSDLLPELSVVDNVALPLRFAGVGKSEARARAAAQVSRLGLGDLVREKIGRLSGGEKQRIGIARATVHSPKLILADEPTGMLDDDNTDSVMGLLLQEVSSLGSALLVATHDRRVSQMLASTVQAEDAGLSVLQGRQ